MDDVEVLELVSDLGEITEVVCDDWQPMNEAAGCGPKVVDALTLQSVKEPSMQLRPFIDDSWVRWDNDARPDRGVESFSPFLSEPPADCSDLQLAHYGEGKGQRVSFDERCKLCIAAAPIVDY